MAKKMDLWNNFRVVALEVEGLEGVQEHAHELHHLQGGQVSEATNADKVNCTVCPIGHDHFLYNYSNYTNGQDFSDIRNIQFLLSCWL